MPLAARRQALLTLAPVTAAALWLAAASLQAGELPEGSVLSVRLASRVSSRASRAGDPVEAVLIAPVRVADGVLVSPGSRLRGRVVSARRGFGRRAALKLAFDELDLPGDGPVEITARVTEVDNAREGLAADGTIVGLAPFSSPPSRAHLALALAASEHPVLLALVELGRFFSKKIQHGAIEYGPGVELDLALQRPARLPDGSAPLAPDPPQASPEPTDLARLVDGLPLRTITVKAGRPSDLTNVVLIGSQAELEAAFAAAGWTRAAELRARTVTRGLLALAGRRAYRPAPVSLLELQNRPPDLVFEKQCNTLAKRHHVRLWGGFGEPGGPAVWVGAASHDVGIVFSRRERAFTHRVDGCIDKERTKLVDDLSFAGRVERTVFVERSEAPRAFVTAAGARIETDGRMAVVVLGLPARSGAAVASAPVTGVTARSAALP